MAQQFHLDGFPDAGDPIQAAIAADLQSAHDRRETNARFSEQFPQSWAALADRTRWQSWFRAALERLDWHVLQAAHPSGEPDWAAHLASLIRAGLWNAQVPLEARAFTLFLRHIERIDRHNHDGPILVAKAIARNPDVLLTSENVGILLPWLHHLVRIHAHGAETFEIALHLWRAGFLEIPWAAPQLRELKPLLDLSRHNWQLPEVEPKHAGKLRAAITKCGEAKVWAAVDNSISGLEAAAPVALSGAAMTLLRQTLQWLQVHDFSGNTGGALYRIAKLRWAGDEITNMLMKEWLATMLRCVSGQPAGQALVCAEMLAHNPQTAAFAEVTLLHEQLMAEAMSGVPEAQPKAVDGYEIRGGMHDVISLMLATSGPAPPNAATQPSLPHFGSRTNVEIAFRQGQSDRNALLEAMHARVRWLAAKAPRGQGDYLEPPWLFWNCDLASLYGRVLESKPQLDRGQLIELCRVDSMRWLSGSITGPLIGLCSEHISRHGYVGELSAAMRGWEKSVHGGGATIQAMRKQIGRLLWFEPDAPLKEKDCWSVRLRLDLREATPASRAAWMAAWGNIPGTFAPGAPTKKWLIPARGLARGIGAEELRARIRAWFEPFRGGRAPLKITTTGRDVLGTLLWYALLAEKKDAQLDEALVWFGQAKWKSKADAGRIAMLLPVWIHVLGQRLAPHAAIEAIHGFRDTGQLPLLGRSVTMYEAICASAGRTPEIAPPPSPSIDLQAMKNNLTDKALLAFGGPGVAFEGSETILVANARTGEKYAISRQDGRMTRLSDGKPVRLEIDWSAPPLLPFKGLVDGQDVADSFAPNHFRLMLCTQALAGTLGLDVRIVADEE